MFNNTQFLTLLLLYFILPYVHVLTGYCLKIGFSVDILFQRIRLDWCCTSSQKEK